MYEDGEMIPIRAPAPKRCPDSESGALRTQPRSVSPHFGGSLPMRPAPLHLVGGLEAEDFEALFQYCTCEAVQHQTR